MSALPKMSHDGPLQLGVLWQRVQFFRALGAEHSAQDPIVVVPGPWNQGKSPLKGQNIRIGRKIFRQLLVEHPGCTGCDTRWTAGLNLVKCRLHATQRLAARVRRQWVESWDVETKRGRTLFVPRAELSRRFIVVPEKWAGCFGVGEEPVGGNLQTSHLVEPRGKAQPIPACEAHSALVVLRSICGHRPSKPRKGLPGNVVRDIELPLALANCDHANQN